MATENNLAQLIADTYKAGGKVLVCGNGGLAAEAEHFAAELMGNFGREIFIPAIALTSNTSLLSALANDYGWSEVFSRQINALAQPNDLIVGMTTSASKNIHLAIKQAQIRGVKAILLDASLFDYASSRNTATIQENILKLLHKAAKEAKDLCS